MKHNPEDLAQQVQANLIRVTADCVKGAHDAQMVIARNKAYLVYEANNVRPGENPAWPDNYAAMSIVDLKSGKVIFAGPFAVPEQQFDNVRLKTGSCFVPRVLRLNESTLRLFFSSTEPGVRQQETWYLDYDLDKDSFGTRIYPVMLQTRLGTFPMEPRHFYAQAKAEGFSKPEKDDGMYLFDIDKTFDGMRYVALNNFPGKQNALGVFNDRLDTVRILGNFNEPQSEDLSEAAIQRTPEGEWIAILRNDSGNQNYRFARSKDGIHWSPAEEWPLVQNGSNSKPIFERFGGVYYLGWQEKPLRSRFNLDVSVDLVHWTRAYSFHDASFGLQYPSLFEYHGEIYLCATHGGLNDGNEHRDHIVFGKLHSVKTGIQIAQSQG